ncbi:MAG: VirB3 family type IV secretion system protein [Pseudomonadota bacterium]
MTTATDPLFVGATRPSLVWGVTYEAIIFCICAVAVLFIGTGNPFLIVFYIPLHGACYLICLKDPRFFRLIGLWIITKGKSTSWRYWGAATACPQFNTRNRRRMPE